MRHMERIGGSRNRRSGGAEGEGLNRYYYKGTGKHTTDSIQMGRKAQLAMTIALEEVTHGEGGGGGARVARTMGGSLDNRRS